MTVPAIEKTMLIMSPIERAARALCAPESDPDEIGHAGVPAWESYLPKVMAVLRELAEPTPAMQEAGAEIVRFANPEHSEAVGESDAANVWRMMMQVLISDIEFPERR